MDLSGDPAHTFDSVVAEQVAVAVPAGRLGWLFDGEEAERLRPLLTVAWREGLASLAVSGHATPAGDPFPLHLLKMGVDESGGLDGRGCWFHWDVVGARSMFSSYVATLAVHALGTGCVLDLKGTATILPGGPPRSGTARRPEEVVVRALLGHLRNAAEHVGDGVPLD
jgi:hypothetical protein